MSGSGIRGSFFCINNTVHLSPSLSTYMCVNCGKRNRSGRQHGSNIADANRNCQANGLFTGCRGRDRGPTMVDDGWQRWADIYRHGPLAPFDKSQTHPLPACLPRWIDWARVCACALCISHPASDDLTNSLLFYINMFTFCHEFLKLISQPGGTNRCIAKGCVFGGTYIF